MLRHSDRRGSWPRFTSDFWRCPLPMNGGRWLNGVRSWEFGVRGIRCRVAPLRSSRFLAPIHVRILEVSPTHNPLGHQPAQPPPSASPFYAKGVPWNSPGFLDPPAGQRTLGRPGGSGYPGSRSPIGRHPERVSQGVAQIHRNIIGHTIGGFRIGDTHPRPWFVPLGNPRWGWLDLSCLRPSPGLLSPTPLG